jgi:hypothetical protein
MPRRVRHPRLTDAQRLRERAAPRQPTERAAADAVTASV